MKLSTCISAAALLFVYIVFSFSCSKDEPFDNLNSEVLYSTSFESFSDTVGWGGYCLVSFTDDVPEDGGSQAISIACADIVPHVFFEIGPFAEDSQVIVSCWGKGFGWGGEVSLQYEDTQISIPIQGEDSEWQYFQSSDTLFCPAGENLTVGLLGGGKIQGRILVDLLEVRKVE